LTERSEGIWLYPNAEKQVPGGTKEGCIFF